MVKISENMQAKVGNDGRSKQGHTSKSMLQWRKQMGASKWEQAMMAKVNENKQVGEGNDDESM